MNQIKTENDFILKLSPDTFTNEDGKKLLFVKMDSESNVYALEGLEKDLFLKIEKNSKLLKAVEEVAELHSFDPNDLYEFALKLVKKLEGFKLVTLSTC